jgi:hypothetical protein
MESSSDKTPSTKLFYPNPAGENGSTSHQFRWRHRSTLLVRIPVRSGWGDV